MLYRAVLFDANVTDIRFNVVNGSDAQIEELLLTTGDPPMDDEDLLFDHLGPESYIESMISTAGWQMETITTFHEVILELLEGKLCLKSINIRLS